MSDYSPLDPPVPGTPAVDSPALEHEFLDVFLHKLSQPLTAARGSLELALLFGRTPEDYRQSIKEAMESIDRLIRIKRTVSELAIGDLSVDFERVSVFSVLLAATEATRQAAEQKRVIVETFCPDSLYVKANPRRLRQTIESCIGAVPVSRKAPRRRKPGYGVRQLAAI